MADAIGIPAEFFVARDEILRAAAKGAFYAVAMSERGAGSRLSALTTSYTPDGERLPDQGREDVRLRRGSRRRISGRRSA